jgi:hypothetical protein
VEKLNPGQQRLDLGRWFRLLPNLKEIQFTNRQNLPEEADDYYLVDIPDGSSGCWWRDTPFKSWNCISCKELYRLEGRTVTVEAERSQYKPFAEPTFDISHNKEIEWLGFVEICGNQAWEGKQKHVHRHLFQAHEQQPIQYGVAIKHLVALNLWGGYLTLDKLEKILEICPNLTELACTLNCRRVPDVRMYMDRLSTLLRNSKVVKFRGKVGRADLLVFARHLAVCSNLWLEGVLIWHDVTEIIERFPVNSAKLSRTVMKPHLATGWLKKDQRINPVAVAQVIRAVFPPGTTVSIIESQPYSAESHEVLWMEHLHWFMNSKSLEE